MVIGKRISNSSRLMGRERLAKQIPCLAAPLQEAIWPVDPHKSEQLHVSDSPTGAADWGRQYGLDPQSTWRMLNEGRLPAHLEVERIGRLWYVILADGEPALLTVGYARVSSHEQKPQLEPQANRLWAHAGQNGIKLNRVVSEVASGLNDRRPKLRRLLADPKVGYILVEHRDRLARFGVGLVQAMLEARSGGLLVIEDNGVYNEVDDDLVRDMTEILTCFCARLYGRRGAANRARQAISAATE